MDRFTQKFSYTHTLCSSSFLQFISKGISNAAHTIDGEFRIAICTHVSGQEGPESLYEHIMNRSILTMLLYEGNQRGHKLIGQWLSVHTVYHLSLGEMVLVHKLLSHSCREDSLQQIA